MAAFPVFPLGELGGTRKKEQVSVRKHSFLKAFLTFPSQPEKIKFGPQLRKLFADLIPQFQTPSYGLNGVFSPAPAPCAPRNCPIIRSPRLPYHPLPETARTVGVFNQENIALISRKVTFESYIRLSWMGRQMCGSAGRSVGRSKLRFYVQVQNLFTVTNYSGLDPAPSNFGQSGLNGDLWNGYDFGNYPAERKILFGVNAGF